MKKKPPSLTQLFEALATQSDKTIEDMVVIVADAASSLMMHWYWVRQLRRMGVLLAKLQDGEALSPAEGKQLAKILTFTAYFVGRSFIGGGQGVLRSLRASESIGHQRSKSKVPPPSSAKWQELQKTLKDLETLARALKQQPPKPPQSAGQAPV